ncbi:hypothetical protein Dimus_006854 [Dionaea muscipula]
MGLICMEKDQQRKTTRPLHCKNNSLCMEKLSLVLPDASSYYTRRFGRLCYAEVYGVCGYKEHIPPSEWKILQSPG